MHKYMHAFETSALPSFSLRIDTVLIILDLLDLKPTATA